MVVDREVLGSGLREPDLASEESRKGSLDIGGITLCRCAVRELDLHGRWLLTRPWRLDKSGSAAKRPGYNFGFFALTTLSVSLSMRA